MVVESQEVNYLRNKKWLIVVIRDFKKLRRLLQQRRHFEIELYVRLSVLKLFHVGYVVQNRRSVLSLVWHECFSFGGRE